MIRIIYIAAILLNAPFVIGQLNDHIWIMGGGSVNAIDDLGFQWGTTVLDFNQDPVSIYYDEAITLDMLGTNASICDNAGHLLLYTNGMYVSNGLHQIVEGLDTIAYSDFWEIHNVKNHLPDGSDWTSGFPSLQAALILPNPSDTNKAAILYNFRENPPGDPDMYSHETKILIAEVEIRPSLPEGHLLYKDSILIEDRFNTALNAVRHANGRDWWVIIQSEYNETYYIYLLDHTGFNLIHEYKGATAITSEISSARAYFSPDGAYYVIAETQGDLLEQSFLTIYHFDRCTGHIEKKEFKAIETFISRGSLAFSADSRYLYVANGMNLLQYDMTANAIFSTEKVIDTWDGSIFQYNEFDPGRRLMFGYMVNGPDGKIYNTPPGGVRSLHTIEYPEEEGEEATVIQNKIALPTQNFNSIPNFPHYRLGPIDGSSCDTLGLDNNPVAKYRYAADSTDHLNVRFTDLSYYEPDHWRWDFGDGRTYDGRKPYWHRFPQGGEYEVCLTVSNQNSENTTCRVLNVGGTVGTKDIGLNSYASIYPNPTDGPIIMRLSGYIPSDGSIEVYGITGQTVFTKRIYYGINSFDLTNVSPGSYIWVAKDGKKVLGQGKLIRL